MKRFLYAPAVAFAVSLLCGGIANADPSPSLPIQWTYEWERKDPALLADGNPGASITFTNEGKQIATGTSNIVATNIRTSSLAPGNTPDKISKGDYELYLTLSLQEGAITHSKTLTFTGTLSGTFSKENSDIENVFGPESIQTIALGSYSFKVTMDKYTPPGPPDQQGAGSIGARVVVSRELQGSDQPEPSTMLLAGLGLTFLGGAAWRRRRAAPPADPTI